MEPAAGGLVDRAVAGEDAAASPARRATGSPPAPAVEVSGVTKWFGEATALDRVDLVVAPGVVHGLVGPNGAGKTTLLSALFGLVVPDEGTLRLFGRTRGEAGSSFLDGVGGFVETPRFYPYLSARANLDGLGRLDGGGASALVDGVLEVVGLGDAGRQKVRGFSLGMRQRLGLAAALLRRPRLLILDEPANGLDPAGIRDLRASIRQLAASGLSVVLSSHDMAQIEEICDEVTVLAGGRVVFTGTLPEMRAEAPEPAWRLATSDDDAARALAAARDDVAATGRNDGAMSLRAGQAALDEYVVELGRAGVAVRALALERSALESLFFHLTGEEAGLP